MSMSLSSGSMASSHSVERSRPHSDVDGLPARNRPYGHKGGMWPGGLRCLHGHAVAPRSADRSGDPPRDQRVPAADLSLDGMIVTTTEGIGNVHEGLDPVQHCIAMHNGTQCGFCTPGFVMTAHAFLQKKQAPSEREIEDIFGGNLCRCTGYRPILHAIRTLAGDYDAATDQTEKCLMDPFYPVPRRTELTPVDMDRLPPSPPRPLHFTGSGREWYRPVTLAEVHRLKRQFVDLVGKQQVKLVFGNTASGVYQNEKPTCFIDISTITELGRIAEQETGIHVGATVPIQHLMDYVTELIGRLPLNKRLVCGNC